MLSTVWPGISTMQVCFSSTLHLPLQAAPCAGHAPGLPESMTPSPQHPHNFYSTFADIRFHFIHICLFVGELSKF